jgi:hypothetical protein
VDYTGLATPSASLGEAIRQGLTMVPLKTLRPGDRVMGEIRGPRGRLLCGAGVTLTPQVLEALKEHGVRLVHVAPRAHAPDDLAPARVQAIESEVAHRFARVAPDSPLDALRLACLSVLLGLAQESEEP